MGMCVLVVLLPIGCFVAHMWRTDRAIEQLTLDADRIVVSIYRFKNRTGDYPKSLRELTVVADGLTPEELAKIKQDQNGEFIYASGAGIFDPNEIMVWRYGPGFSEIDPPKLAASGSLDHGRYLAYEFRPTKAWYMPLGKDEGWITGTEAGRKHVRSVDFAYQEPARNP